MSPNTKIDTLIISDLHLGAPVGKARKVSALLQNLKFKRLILLGDILDDAGFSYLKDTDHQLLFLIKELSAPQKDLEIVWISGNHDRHLGNMVSRHTGLKIKNHFIWEHRGKRFAAIHGDQFDSFITNNSRVDRFAHSIFLFLQHLDSKGRHIIKYIDRTNAFIRRLSKKVSSGAIAYARNNQITHIFCGHTHLPMQKIHHDGDSPVHYTNVGCWTHTPSTFAVIDDNGDIAIEEIS